MSKKSIAHWIPVSEGLPKTNGYYLTNTMYGEVYCDYWTGVRFDRTETVIAWSEVPEAYNPHKVEGGEL